MVKSMILVIRAYQKIIRSIIFIWPPVISPVAPQCRFQPTCSDYFIDALVKYGFWVGSAKGLSRVFKCNPFSRGGVDCP